MNEPLVSTDRVMSLSYRMRTVAALVRNDETRAALEDGAMAIDALLKALGEMRSDAEYFRENRDAMGAEVLKLRGVSPIQAARQALSGEYTSTHPVLTLLSELVADCERLGFAEVSVELSEPFVAARAFLSGSTNCMEQAKRETCPSCAKEHNRQCDDGWHI